MTLEARHLNMAVRVIDLPHPLFGAVGRVLAVQDGTAVVRFDPPVNHWWPAVRVPEEHLLEAAALTWEDLYRENRRLRQALEAGEAAPATEFVPE